MHEAGCDAALVPRQREDALLSGHALGWAGVFRDALVTVVLLQLRAVGTMD